MKKTYQYKVKGPIKNWHEGLMLGNGHFGALIYGENNIEISLDLSDLWDNRLTPEMKSKDFNYPNMIKLMNEDWDEYLRLFDGSYSHPNPTKINAGTLLIKEQIKNKDKLQVDIKNAEYSLCLENCKINGYLDANQDVLVVNCDKNIEFEFKMPDCFYRKEKGIDYPKPTINYEDDFSSVIQKTKSGFTYFILIYRVSDASNSLYVTVRKTKNIDKDFEEAKSCLINYHKKVNENHSKHSKYWQSFYRRSSVITGEYKIDRLYNFGRYFLSCNSKGKYPMSLEGVWTRNDGNLPPWKGDYHLDINLQMSYESYMKTGDFKEGKVLVDYLLRNKNKFKKLAKVFCKTDGYYIPGVMSQNCTPLGGWPMYAMNPCNAIWILSAFDNYYRYTGNRSFLEKKAYPFIIQVEKCLSSLMQINKNGHIEFEFSASPEINDCNKNAIFKEQTNFEISMLHYLYRLLVEYSELLDVDATYFKNQLSLVANYKLGKEGEIIIGDDLTYSESHRHFSHILCHKNLENFTPYEDLKQILIDYKRLEKYGTSEWVGFSFTEAASLASYIELGEEAYRYIYAFSDAFINDNCFHMNMDFNNKGYSTIYSYAFTLEANMGFVRAVTDMMLRTTRDIITVFPAIPSHFKQNSVKFKNLRAYDNTKVSGSFINNSMKFEIKPRIEKTIKIYNNFKDNPTLMVGKEMIQIKALKGEIIQITTKDKITYLGD